MLHETQIVNHIQLLPWLACKSFGDIHSICLQVNILILVYIWKQSDKNLLSSNKKYVGPLHKIQGYRGHQKQRKQLKTRFSYICGPKHRRLAEMWGGGGGSKGIGYLDTRSEIRVLQFSWMAVFNISRTTLLTHL